VLGDQQGKAGPRAVTSDVSAAGPQVVVRRLLKPNQLIR